MAHYRKAFGLTQEGLARRLRVAPATISRLERGAAIPSLVSLEKIAHSLGITLGQLFDFDYRASTNPVPEEKALEALNRYLRGRNAGDVKLVYDLARRVFRRPRKHRTGR